MAYRVLGNLDHDNKSYHHGDLLEESEIDIAAAKQLIADGVLADPDAPEVETDTQPEEAPAPEEPAPAPASELEQADPDPDIPAAELSASEPEAPGNQAPLEQPSEQPAEQLPEQPEGLVDGPAVAGAVPSTELPIVNPDPVLPITPAPAPDPTPEQIAQDIAAAEGDPIS